MNKKSHYLQHHVLCSRFVHLRNVTDHAVCKTCSGFVHIRKMTMLLAKPVVFWFYLHQDTVHVVCKACCVLVLFVSGNCPCGLQSPLCSGFVRIGKTSMWFEKPVAFWFCLHQENVHVVCKACCVPFCSHQENVHAVCKAWIVFTPASCSKLPNSSLEQFQHFIDNCLPPF